MRLGTPEYLQNLIVGAPLNYPVGHQVEGVDQIPKLRPATLDLVPSELCSFNDFGRSSNPAQEAVHFYKNDIRFIAILRNPKPFGFKASGFKALLTPDVTLGLGMPEWMRKRNTVLSRMCGVVWQSQGLSVIPSLRWVCHADLEFVSMGIERGSIFAVSSYGSERNKNAKLEFERGVLELVKILQPAALMVYGLLDRRLNDELSLLTRVFVYKPNSFRKRTEPTTFDNVEISLF
jgi:hypothetical protein